MEAGELLQHRHHSLGLATPSHADRQAVTAEFVDHARKLQPLAIGGGVELEVHGAGWPDEDACVPVVG
jgi:hypothetical protein